MANTAPLGVFARFLDTTRNVQQDLHQSQWFLHVAATSGNFSLLKSSRETGCLSNERTAFFACCKKDSPCDPEVREDVRGFRGLPLGLLMFSSGCSQASHIVPGRCGQLLRSCIISRQ